MCGKDGICLPTVSGGKRGSATWCEFKSNCKHNGSGHMEAMCEKIQRLEYVRRERKTEKRRRKTYS